MEAPLITAADEILARASSAAIAGEAALRDALDALAAAVYVTDPRGVVTHFNPACVDFAGRQPKVGEDRWCVTWRLYANDGEILPHDACPMAFAILKRRPVRDVTAVAERPDGTRVPFRPYPTPIFHEDGSFAGAVNILEDVTEETRAMEFAAQAQRARSLARAILDAQAKEGLLRLADENEAKAAAAMSAVRPLNRQIE